MTNNTAIHQKLHIRVFPHTSNSSRGLCGLILKGGPREEKEGQAAKPWVLRMFKRAFLTLKSAFLTLSYSIIFPFSERWLHLAPPLFTFLTFKSKSRLNNSWTNIIFLGKDLPFSVLHVIVYTNMWHAWRLNWPSHCRSETPYTNCIQPWNGFFSTSEHLNFPESCFWCNRSCPLIHMQQGDACWVTFVSLCSPAEHNCCSPFAGVWGKKRWCQVSDPAVFSLGEKCNTTSVLLQKYFCHCHPCSLSSYQNPISSLSTAHSRKYLLI